MKQLFHGFFADALDVHHLSAHEVLHAACQLRGASELIGALPCSLTLNPDERCAACRTMAYEPHRFCSGFALAHVHSGYLGYDFPTFLNIEHVVLMDAEGVDYVFVVQRCAFHHRA